MVLIHSNLYIQHMIDILTVGTVVQIRRQLHGPSSMITYPGQHAALHWHHLHVHQKLPAF